MPQQAIMLVLIHEWQMVAHIVSVSVLLLLSFNEIVKHLETYIVVPMVLTGLIIPTGYLIQMYQHGLV